MPTSAADAYADLIRRAKETSVLASCAALLGWDERTYMPTAGSGHRAEQMALLARLTHERATAPEVGDRLAAVEASDLVRDPEGDAVANVRELRRAYDRAVKLPRDLVEELARVTTQAQQVWAEARKASNFAAFLPWLERIVALKRREADAVGHRGHPYDALLDEYEPGATTAEITAVFAALRAELAPLVQALAASGRKAPHEILEREYPVEAQKAFGETAARAIGFDFRAGRLDVTTHPFCSGIGPGDVRLTTRYNPRHFNEAFFGVLHEAGHGLYEQNLPADAFGTPLGGACSLGVHESQSRLWENQVGRGRPFWEFFYPKAQAAFPQALGGVSLDQWLFAINDVRASFIRVEADEATYNLHIILRFEIEQGLISGDLAPRDVPAAWAEKMRTFFGLTPPDDARGCLQDIHWSGGGLGYFPTYTLGNLYAAQLMAAARRDLGGLDDDFRNGAFGRLKEWLTTKVYRHGMRWRAAELCRRAVGEPLSHRPLLDYLRAKYEPLYGVGSPQ